MHVKLGMTLQAMGQFDDAIRAFRKAIHIKSDDAQTWSNLGVLLHDHGQTDAALDTLLAPDYAVAHADLNRVMIALGRPAEAVAACRNAINPGIETSKIYLNIGVALQDLGLQDEAITAYQSAINLDPSNADAAQGHSVTLNAELAKRIAPSYNRLVHIPDSEPIAGPLLNPALDTAQLERAYLESRPAVVTVDDFLSQPTLQAIRTFCMEATVWKKEYPNGYLGATLKDGFSSALILQISEERRTRFPAIFGGHLLEQAWAFKYDSTMKIINVHADFAAFNVNLWIKHNAACLDFERGGLVIWDTAEPKDWSFQTYNGDEPQIRKFLSRSGAKLIRVPYRENR